MVASTEGRKPKSHPSHRGRITEVRRRLRRRLRSVVVALAGCIMLGSLVGPTHAATVKVVVDHNGERRTVYLARKPSVRTALGAAAVQVVAAHLLSARTHQPISGHDIPATMTVNGRPATEATVAVGSTAHIEVVDAQDAVEAVVFRPVAPIPPPPLPGVIRTLWQPGSPGTVAESQVGAVSGEVVSGRVLATPSAPAPVRAKLVALTFDDGPWPDTAQFLAVLRGAGIKATFCMIGTQVSAHPEWVKAVVAGGMQTCNHTLHHNVHLDRADPATIRSEVRGGADALADVVGQAATLYRPPGGALSPLIEQDAAALGEQVIGWSVDPSDYKKPGVARIVATVMAQVRPGAIILLHDGGGDRSQTLTALPEIITALKAQGYSFTTPGAIPPVPGTIPIRTPSSQPDHPTIPR